MGRNIHIMKRGGRNMYEIYTVQEGDTVDSVANRFGLGVNELEILNNLDANEELKPGRNLIIPVKLPPAFEYYTVQKGDTLSQIAKKNNIDLSTLEQLNGLDPNEYIMPGQRLIIPKEGVYVYITKPGDTINLLAQQYKIPPEDLIFYNHNIYLLPEQLIAFKYQPQKNA